jgi:hypothetical protein
MSIQCEPRYLKAFLDDQYIRNECLEFGLEADQILSYPNVDEETRETVEFVFNSILRERYLPTIADYWLPEGFEQYGSFATIFGIKGFYVVTFSNAEISDGEVFSELTKAEERVEVEQLEFMKEFESTQAEVNEILKRPKSSE